MVHFCFRYISTEGEVSFSWSNFDFFVPVLHYLVGITDDVADASDMIDCSDMVWHF